MTDAPKRIWAWVDGMAGVVGSTEKPETPEHLPPGPNAVTLCAEYVRADLPTYAVKPLEWVRHNVESIYLRNGDQFAETAFGSYMISRFTVDPYWFVRAPDGSDVGVFGDEEAAKSAAETDYERRIRSALKPGPSYAVGYAQAIEDAHNALFVVPAASIEQEQMAQRCQAAIRALRPEPGPDDAQPLDLVPERCTSIAFSFEPGTLWIKKDGSGHLAINEEDFSCEDDRCEGPDGPEGSIHWIARMDASEIVALRDFLNGAQLPGPDDTQAKLDEAVKALEATLTTLDLWEPGEKLCFHRTRAALAKIRGTE